LPSHPLLEETMSDDNTILALSNVSDYPDIDLDLIYQAVDQAWAGAKDSPVPDIVSRAMGNLPAGASEFERGVVAGVILARVNR